MDGRLFVSYSRADGGDIAARLADELESGSSPYTAWVDQREIHPGRDDWDDQLMEAIQTCWALLFVMTRDSVRAGSACKDEWGWALKYKKPVIPVRVDAEADLPFRLGSRQFVDFSANFASGLADLRRQLRWMSTPEGQLRELQTRLAEAERELPRADAGQQSRIEQEMTDLRQRIEAQRRLVDHPQTAIEQTDVRIRAGMELERQPAPVVAVRALFVNPPPMIAPPYFQDRYVETELIGAFLRDEGLRMMTVTGRSGIGKTAMVCRLLRALEGGRLPDDLGELAVGGIVYLCPAGMHPVNFPDLFNDLCRLLPADLAGPLLARYRDPQATPAALMRDLLGAFPAGRPVVVLLDGFEGLVDRETFALTDAALDEALRTVLTAPVHGVKVIITTRVAPRGLLLAQPAVQRRLSLDEGLPSPYAENVLRARDADGSLGVRNAPAALLDRAREWTLGFPRALEALVAILAADRSTTLPGLLADAERMPENVVEVLVGEMFSRLDVLGQQVMQALAIYEVPVPPVAVDYLLRFFQPVIDSAPVLSRLVNMSIVRGDAGRYYLHPVDRGYALGRMADGKPSDLDAQPLPFTRYALRGRGADYFRRIRSPRETWRSLADLAPLQAEFELRCQIGDYDTAAQVLFDVDLEYLIRWGNYRLALDLHDRLQGHLTDPRTDSASKCNLGICYAALGQTQRAIELHQLSLAIAREIGARLTEANQLRHLGDCHADLGMWQQAGGYCEQAVQISDEIGFAQGSSQGRLSLATVHLHAGDLDAALRAAQAAPAGGYPPAAADLSLVAGIVLVRQDQRDAAGRAPGDRCGRLQVRALAACSLGMHHVGRGPARGFCGAGGPGGGAGRAGCRL